MLTINKAIMATQWRPNFKAGTAKKFVPIKYPILSGKKTMPSCHFSGCIVSINHMGKQGSSNAIAVVDTQTAPVTIKMLIFVNSFKKSVGFSFSSSILCAGNFGGRDLIWRPKSKKVIYITIHSMFDSILLKYLITQGPLNIWTEHSNCQICTYIVGLINPYSFNDTQYFLDSFYKIIFLCI